MVYSEFITAKGVHVMPNNSYTFFVNNSFLGLIALGILLEGVLKRLLDRRLT